MGANELFIPGLAPFAMSPEAKAGYLEKRLADLLEHHAARCAGYARLIKQWPGSTLGGVSRLEDYPYVPVTLFKEYDLRSSSDPVAIVQSSATTSAQAAKVYTDKESRKRQIRSANLLLGDFVGFERRPYIVFDIEETVRGSKGFSARGAAIMALAHMASDFHFVMRPRGDALELDHDALVSALKNVGDRPFLAYGFTYILYQAHLAIDVQKIERAHPDSMLLHSGGWKRLSQESVDKATFNEVVAHPWKLPPTQVIDYYGMVEQIGMVYPDCPAGRKHVPYWAEVIMRHADTLEPAAPGEPGLIQLISCLPLAAPNHSVLSEDLGVIVESTGCACGRLGTSFEFLGRAPKSETRGCSDVVRR